MLLFPFAVLLDLLPSLPPAVEAPLQVVAVVRQGLPPYEEDERLYRLEGKGAALLRVGDKIRLTRLQELSPGKLKVTEAHGAFVLASLEEEGENYPLKGDLAERIEPPRPLPSLVVQGPEEASPALPSLEARLPVRELPRNEPLEKPKPLEKPPAEEPRLVVPPAPPPSSATPAPDAAPVVLGRQPIYFLKGNPSLSPGAFGKLKQVVASWGATNRWMLGYPGTAGLIPTVQQERLTALKAELMRLGVGTVEVRLFPPDPPAKYEAVYVMCESR